MANQIIGGIDVLEFESSLFDLAVVLRPKELQDAVVGRAKQGALGRIGVPGAECVDEGALVVIARAGAVRILDGRSMEDIVLVLSVIPFDACMMQRKLTWRFWGMSWSQ